MSGGNGGGESKHSPRRIEAVEDQAKALEYRKMGLSYDQIAKKLGWAGPQGAWYAVEAALKRLLREPADAVRSLEVARLDAMFIPVYVNATRGDMSAITACINIMNRRARLLGIDTPVVAPGMMSAGAEVVAAAVRAAVLAANCVTGEPQTPEAQLAATDAEDGEEG